MCLLFAAVFLVGAAKMALNLRVVRAVIKGQGFVGDDLRIVPGLNPTMFRFPGVGPNILFPN